MSPTCVTVTITVTVGVSLPLIAMCEVHSSMGRAVQVFCCGDWDPKRVPQGTECLEPLLDAAPSHQPRMPQRCFTGENRGPVAADT